MAGSDFDETLSRLAKERGPALERHWQEAVWKQIRENPAPVRPTAIQTFFSPEYGLGSLAAGLALAGFLGGVIGFLNPASKVSARERVSPMEVFEVDAPHLPATLMRIDR